MEDRREDNWRDVAEDGEVKSKIYSLRWYVYTIENKDLIKREFLVFFTYPKGGNIIWTCA